MAVSLHRAARPGGGRRSRARRHTPMHEINVTPFVDVMLVLLIIFMVTAPLLLSGLPVDLPSVKGQSLNVNKELLTVTLDRDGRVYLGSAEEPVEVGQLATKLKAIAKNAEEETILFRGDRQVEYGRVSEVLNAVIQGGYKKFTFVSGPEEIQKETQTGPAKK
ncbi:MAG TPA: biopolymer transporter ExbD [Hyphomicrobiaceae bacterium]|jgi:biopolymer transport protein TolR|nr:biopolymer transporter ExbD [Hyphomicrobiaceae bacterium]